MADFWKSFGTNYDEINKNLGGIPDFIKGVGQRINDLPVNQFMAKHPVIGAIYSGAQSAANTVTGGLQGAANQALDPTGTQGLADVQAQHPIGTGIGQGVGLAGGMALTPTAPAAEAGTAAAKFFPTLGRNALTAGAMSAPGTVAEGIQTGDWKQALAHGLKNTGIGAFLGAGAEKGAEALGPLLNKIQAKALGMSSRDLKQSINTLAQKQGVNKMGAQAAQGESLLEKVVNLGNKFGAYTKKGKEALWAFVRDGYQKLAELYDKASPQIADALPNIANSNSLSKVRQLFGSQAVDDELLRQAGQIEKMDWTTARIHTREMMEAALREKEPDLPVKLKGAVADVLHNYLGDTAQNLATQARAAGNAGITDLHDLDAVYGAAKAIHGAEAREALSLPATFSPGSDTAARVGVNKILMEGLGGVGGLGVAAATGGIDPNDPSTYLPTIAKIAAGSVAGRILNRGAGKLAEMTSGLTARGLKAGLGAAEGVSPQIAQLGARLPQMAQQAAQGQAEAPEQTTEALAGPTSPEQAPAEGGISRADIEALGGGSLTPAQQTVKNAQPSAEIPAPEHAKQMASAVTKEQQLSPAQISAARQLMAPNKDAIRQRLLSMYQAWENPYKDDWEKFYKDAQTYTDDFSPTNQLTARIIGGADYKDYLKAYNVALRLQTLGPDLAKAINYLPVQIAQPRYLEARRIRKELVDTLYTAMTGDLKAPGKADREMIENKLKVLRDQKVTPNSAKKQLLEMMQRDYGLRTDLLDQYGMSQ